MTTSMSSPPVPARRSPLQSVSLVATATGVSLMFLVALLAGNIRGAGASEFYANPTLSVINECSGGQYLYHLGLYNFDANDSTEFTVEIAIGDEPAQTTVHSIPAGGLLWIDTVVPEGVMGSFHVTNSDDAAIDHLAEPTADCVADPLTQVLLVCPSDGSAPLALYEWVNTSYAPAHFTLHLPDGSLQEGDYEWIDHEQYLEVPVAEGDHLVAAIDVDGVTLSSLDLIVDCVEDATTVTTLPTPPTTTPPTTTPSTTTPPTTTPSTTTPTSSSVPGATVPGPARPEQLAVVLDVTGGRDAADPIAIRPTRPTPVAPAANLAFTGGETAVFATVGTLLLLAGLVSVAAGRRRRAPGES